MKTIFKHPLFVWIFGTVLASLILAYIFGIGGDSPTIKVDVKGNGNATAVGPNAQVSVNENTRFEVKKMSWIEGPGELHSYEVILTGKGNFIAPILKIEVHPKEDLGKLTGLSMRISDNGEVSSYCEALNLCTFSNLSPGGS